MVRKPIFDTSVFSDYADEIEKIYTSALFPTVVLYELTATSIDDSTLQKYERWRLTLNKINGIINPTKTDWWETSKAIRRLYLMKAAPQSKLKTIRNDALISRLAVMHDGFVVTHDIDDFQIIQKAMSKLDVISANEFFS
jgi:predicted nucleic acid-binding protein